MVIFLFKKFYIHESLFESRGITTFKNKEITEKIIQMSSLKIVHYFYLYDKGDMERICLNLNKKLYFVFSSPKILLNLQKSLLFSEVRVTSQPGKICLHKFCKILNFIKLSPITAWILNKTWPTKFPTWTFWLHKYCQNSLQGIKLLNKNLTLG